VNRSQKAAAELWAVVRLPQSVSPKYLPQHPILKHPQPVFSKYGREIALACIFNFIFFKTNDKTERSSGYENFSLLLNFYEFIFEMFGLFRNL